MFNIFRKKTDKIPKEKLVKKKKKKPVISFGFREEKEYFIENVTMLLGAGMNVLLTLEAVKSEMRSKKIRQVIDGVENDIKDGSPLWRALKGTGFLPDYVISLVRIGEESGKLANNLEVISQQQNKEKVFKSKIHSAMMYPALVVSLTLVIGTGIAWFILPKLSSVFDSLQMDLPILTRVLIAVGEFLAVYGIIVIPAILFFIFLIVYFVFVFPRTKFIGQEILIRFPVIKVLIRQVELSRFGYILGTLLDAGIPITNSLNSLSKASTFRPYSNFYNKMKEEISEGNSFSQIFENNPKGKKIIPVTVQQMIISGEQSGNLSKTLLKIGEVYEVKIENTTKNLSVILEPILLVIVWLGVVFVALAVIMPIYSLIGGLNEDNNTTNTTTRPDPVERTISNDPGFKIEGSETLETGLETDKKLKIKDTGVGFLNVRDIPSKNGKILERVTPGDEFVYINEENEWYEIILKDKGISGEDENTATINKSEESSDQNTGWVIGTYVEKIEKLEEIIEE